MSQMKETVGLFLFVAVIVIIALLLRRSRLLAIVPRIHDEGEKLIASTSLCGLLLSLTLLHRTVVVDPAKQAVEIHTQVFWPFKWTRTIPFDSIEKIIYESLPGVLVTITSVERQIADLWCFK